MFAGQNGREIVVVGGIDPPPGITEDLQCVLMRTHDSKSLLEKRFQWRVVGIQGWANRAKPFHIFVRGNLKVSVWIVQRLAELLQKGFTNAETLGREIQAGRRVTGTQKQQRVAILANPEKILKGSLGFCRHRNPTPIESKSVPCIPIER